MNIKFAAVTRKGKEINSVVTTVNALEEHKILTADYGSKFALQSFEIFEFVRQIEHLSHEACCSNEVDTDLDLGLTFAGCSTSSCSKYLGLFSQSFFGIELFSAHRLGLSWDPCLH